MGTRMSLAEFYQYARENRKRIADIYREIEEIQYKFNDLYSRHLEERQTLIDAHVPSLLGSPEDVPVELKQLLEARERIEREAITQETARLEAEIADKRQKGDGLIQEAQRQVAYLREQNPVLDQQEEELKARDASMRNQLQRLETEIKQLNRFPIGWLTNFFRRRRLRGQHAELEENLESVKAGIVTVREKWQAEKKRLQETQTDLQRKWQTISVETAQLQARLDYLTVNIDEQSRRNAAQNLLSNLKELPAVEGAWTDRLDPLVELTRKKTNYETGLTAVAEILGLLKGLGEGMDRFIRSVATVYEEQRRYKLPSLTVNLSDATTSFQAVWPDFQSKVKDEKYLGTHPLEFNRRIQDIVQERINEAGIEKMFDDMGKALNRATKAWR
jgi:chromosome segregation ATPase